MEDLKNDSFKLKNAEQNYDAALGIEVQINTINSVETASTRLEKIIDKKKIEIANLEQDDNSLDGLNKKEEAVSVGEIHSISLKNATNKSELETVDKKVYDDVIKNITDEKENLTLEKNTDAFSNGTSNKNNGLKNALLDYNKIRLARNS